MSGALVAEAGLTNGRVLLDVQPRFGLGDKATQPTPITVTAISKESPFHLHGKQGGWMNMRYNIPSRPAS